MSRVGVMGGPLLDGLKNEDGSTDSRRHPRDILNVRNQEVSAKTLNRGKRFVRHREIFYSRSFTCRAHLDKKETSAAVIKVMNG